MRLVLNRRSLTVLACLAACLVTSGVAQSQQAKDLTKTLPAAGQLDDGKPNGDGWKSLLADGLSPWAHEKEYWSLKDDVLHGDSQG